jgi:Pyruvate/2-oxoacid:ferredoxin oxidoreductase gamma subunit
MAWPGDWMRVSLPLAGAAVLAAALHFAPGSARAATYKWVDDKGVTHYTDRVPPEAVNKGNVELSKQGVPIRKTEPAPTPEQRRAKAQEDERQKQLAKQQDEIARRDRALLSSYTSESEIDLARSRTMRTINSVVQSAQAYSEQLNKRKAAIEAKKKADFADTPAPPALERELANINAELARQADLIALKKRETAEINARYDTDKQRWRELIAAKGGEPAVAARVANGGGGAPAAGDASPYPGATPKK